MIGSRRVPFNVELGEYAEAPGAEVVLLVRERPVMVGSRRVPFNVELGEYAEEPGEDVVRFPVELLELATMENQVERQPLIEGAFRLDFRVDEEAVAVAGAQIREEGFGGWAFGEFD